MNYILRYTIKPNNMFMFYKQTTTSSYSTKPIIEKCKPLINYQMVVRLFHSSKLLKTVPATNSKIGTDIAKDIIVFKYENPRFFKILNIFTLCQFTFWNYISYTAFTTLRDAKVANPYSETAVWYEKINLGETKYRYGITLLFFFIGKNFYYPSKYKIKITYFN